MSPGARGKGRIEAEPEVIVKSAGIRKLTITGLAVGRLSGRGFARVLREVEVRDDGVDVTFAEIGETVCECGVISGSEFLREMGFQPCEVGGSEIFRGGESWAGVLVFKVVEITIVFGVCRGGTTIRECVMALLQSYAACGTACSFCSLRGLCEPPDRRG
jgi:hypothetical protein